MQLILRSDDYWYYCVRPEQLEVPQCRRPLQRRLTRLTSNWVPAEHKVKLA